MPLESGVKKVRKGVVLVTQESSANTHRLAGRGTPQDSCPRFIPLPSRLP